MMLRGVGFEVVDLGVDAPPEKFVEAVREHRPAVVGMSILLTTCFKSVAATVGAINDAGLRDGLTIMLGGAAASEMLRDNTGCDFYGKTAVDGMRHACAWSGRRQPSGSPRVACGGRRLLNPLAALATHHSLLPPQHRHHAVGDRLDQGLLVGRAG